LDIPPELQGRLAPKAVETKPEPEEADIPVQPEKANEEPEELEPDEDEAEPEETEAPAAEQAPQKVDKRLKRINRLTRKKAELETQLDSVAAENYRLRQELSKGQAQAPQNQPPGLTGGRLATLQSEIDKCDAMLEWCDQNADGTEIGEGAEAKYYDAGTIKAWRRSAETARQEKVVEKREELWNLEQARKQSDQSAYQLWPEMFDKRNPEFQEAVALIRQYPFLQALPEANLVLGTFLEGRKKLREKLNGKNGQVQKQHRDIDERVFTTPRVPIAPHSPEPPTRESKPSSQKQLNEAMSRLAKDSDGSSDSVAEVFAAMEKTRQSRPNSRSPVKS
jgi:hypothetical protein